ncbi:hypothetical protein [Streptomyces sp. NPDC056701]|uniref:hypothetical protein n=1 Tax=unclassified Streptomyces TaxID=2593676 RepID=UPI0036C86599
MFGGGQQRLAAVPDVFEGVPGIGVPAALAQPVVVFVVWHAVEIGVFVGVHVPVGLDPLALAQEGGEVIEPELVVFDRCGRG